MEELAAQGIVPDESRPKLTKEQANLLRRQKRKERRQAKAAEKAARKEAAKVRIWHDLARTRV